MTGTVRRVACGIAILLVVMTVPATRITAAGRTPQRGTLHLDAILRGSVDSASGDPQRVIIRTKPGSRGAVREGLVAHGDQIIFEHDSLNALTAVVHGDDLAELGGSDAVL